VGSLAPQVLKNRGETQDLLEAKAEAA
jgi:hypothetical protein